MEDIIKYLIAVVLGLIVGNIIYIKFGRK